MVSGRLGAAPLAAETLRVEAGRVVSVGAATAEADVVVDAAGAVAAPGLVDTHCHVVFGDYTPRQHAVGFLESYLHGGVTQVMSASEVHLPGRPRDRAGVKALAVAAQRAWTGFRPGGVKVRGGSLICEPVLREPDFAELAAEGVRYMKVGFGAFADPLEAVPLVGWARAAGFVVMSHSGGASIPGSSPITVDHLLAMDPTIAGHANSVPLRGASQPESGFAPAHDWTVLLTPTAPPLGEVAAGEVLELDRAGRVPRGVAGNRPLEAALHLAVLQRLPVDAGLDWSRAVIDSIQVRAEKGAI